MNIGKPEEIITVMPIQVPAPLRRPTPSPEPVEAPAQEPKKQDPVPA